MLTAQPGCRQIGREDPGPHVDGRLQRRSIKDVHQTGVVVDHVYPAERLLDARVGILDLGLHAEIQRQTQFTHGVVLLVDADDDRPLSFETAGHAFAESADDASDHTYFAAEATRFGAHLVLLGRREIGRAPRV